MATNNKFLTWCLDTIEFGNINPVQARILLSECLASVRLEMEYKLDTADKKTVRAAISASNQTLEEICAELGIDFHRPTRAGLQQLVEHLSIHAASEGIPHALIDRHLVQVLRMLEQVRPA